MHGIFFFFNNIVSQIHYIKEFKKIFNTNKNIKNLLLLKFLTRLTIIYRYFGLDTLVVH